MGNFIGKILGTGSARTIEAIGNTIDKIDKSDEKMEMRLKYRELLNDMESAYLGYENKLLESRAQIVQAEAKGESVLQRNWRPILMMVCIFIVFNNYVLVPYFQLPTVVLDHNIWNLIQLGVTGYVAGRSLEKISQNVGAAFLNGKQK